MTLYEGKFNSSLWSCFLLLISKTEWLKMHLEIFLSEEPMSGAFYWLMSHVLWLLIRRWWHWLWLSCLYLRLFCLLWLSRRLKVIDYLNINLTIEACIIFQRKSSPCQFEFLSSSLRRHGLLTWIFRLFRLFHHHPFWLNTIMFWPLLISA